LQTADLPWVGSANQRYIHLSDRYLSDDFHAVDNGLEIRFDLDGKVTVNGLEDNRVVQEILRRYSTKSQAS